MVMEAIAGLMLESATTKEAITLVEELRSIKVVLDDGEDGRFKDKMLNYFCWRLQQASYEIEDVLEEFKYATLKKQMSADSPSKQKVCSFIPSSCLWFNKDPVRHNVYNKMLNVKAQACEILVERYRYRVDFTVPESSNFRVESTPMVNLENIHGRDRDRDILVNKLLLDNGDDIPVISIVGGAGIGKTALAQLVYNQREVEQSFDLMIWICVSDPFNLFDIAKEIVESIEAGSSNESYNLDYMFQLAQEFIRGRIFLLVLDDVWTVDYSEWEFLQDFLRCVSESSRILVTTRDERVAELMGSRKGEIFRPGLLSDEDCWLTLWHMAHCGREEGEFQEIGKKIAKKCNGLPLTARALGKHLRFKNSLEAWENVLRVEIWKMKEAEDDIFLHLLLSYYKLSPIAKRCFSYCVVFPRNTEIDVVTLTENWMALGYLESDYDHDDDDGMELRGRDCFKDLVKLSLLEVHKEDNCGVIQSCKMQDIVHDFVQFLRKSHRVPPMKKSSTTCQTCDPCQVSLVNDTRSLYRDQGTPPTLCDCLVPLRVLSLANCGLKSIPQGMENLIHLKWLNLIGATKISRGDLKVIFQLYGLQTLSLRDCGIKEIPSEIKNLIRLRRLDLSLNRFLKELTKEIGNLSKLRCLDLSGNESLTELPIEIRYMRGLHLIGRG